MPDPIFISAAGRAASPEELVRAVSTHETAPSHDLPEVPCLELAEKIVRAAAFWQDPTTGRIIDPYVHRETPTATARYIGALGALMLQGRCLDLAESCMKALEPVLQDLNGIATNHGEFLVKESLFACMALKDKTDAQRYRRWGEIYSGYDPEKSYGRTRTTTPDPEQRHNFVTFALAGEAMKKYLGFGNNSAFFSSYLDEQLARFDELGMYRDPGAPVVYDITARMNLEIARFFAGDDFPEAEQLKKKLRGGAFCSLLYQSPAGEMPFGGRSNQQNFVEASFALICELEARSFKAEGDLAAAGIFRRAAARAVRSVESYLTAEPVRFNKNRFPPETQHGRQLGYGYYGAYTLLIASQLAMASFFADRSIPFAGTTPAESGTFLWRTTDVFHKIFVNAAGSHLELELANDTNYDAVGWGRWHLAGAPPELVLSTPVPVEQKFVSVIPATGALNFGPGTGAEGYVSNFSMKDPALSSLHDIEVREKEVSFVIDWPFEAGIVSEKIRLMPGAAETDAVNNAGTPVSYHVPMILTDGESWSVISETEAGFDVAYKGYVFSISAEGFHKEKENRTGASRNALYIPARFDSRSNRIKLSFTVTERGKNEDI